jgi:RNA-binding protein Tab2/Atab2
MSIWQVDFYRRQSNADTLVLWDLLICDASSVRDNRHPAGHFRYESSCPQSQANSNWLASELEKASQKPNSGGLPNIIQVFRPQSLSLIQAAVNNLITNLNNSNIQIEVEATRQTPALKQWLEEKGYPIIIDKPPPVPLPENIWGEEWRFGTLLAGDITEFINRPIPIRDVPDFLLPMNLGLASTQTVPGIVIYGGRRSMWLARWLRDVKPVTLNYIAGAPDGLVLEAGLAERWIVATFEGEEIAIAAKSYEQRKQESRGLHFLLVQPDDSEMTYTGFWLLQREGVDS